MDVTANNATSVLLIRLCLNRRAGRSVAVAANRMDMALPRLEI